MPPGNGAADGWVCGVIYPRPKAPDNMTGSIRDLFPAAMLVLALMATGCRSHLSEVFDECLSRERSSCAMEVAMLELEKNPGCCECLAHRALAAKQLVLSGHHAAAPAEAARVLMQAASDFERAAVCGRGDSAYTEAARDTTQLYRDLLADRDPSLWGRITSISDPAARMEAVLAHHLLFGQRCVHDVQSEYRAYVRSMARAPVHELRRRLAEFAATPISDELFATYVLRRREERGGDELETMAVVRDEMRGTPNEDLAVRILEAEVTEAVSGTDDPEAAERLCAWLPPGPAREACDQRSQTLWAKSMAVAPPRRLASICPRLVSEKLRQECETELARRALTLAANDPTPEHLALVEAACAHHETYARDWKLLLLRLDAEANFDRLVNRAPDLRLGLAESVSLWNDFVDVFDVLASRVSGDQQETLRSLHPILVEQIDRRRRDLRAEAWRRHRARASDCRVIVQESKNVKSVTGQTIAKIDQCVTDMATIVALDQERDDSRGLLNDLEASMCHLAVKRSTDWTTVIVPLLLTEAIRNFASPGLAQLVFRTLRAVEF